MRFQLKPCIASLLLAGICAAPAFATDVKHTKNKQSLEAKVDRLEREVDSMKSGHHVAGRARSSAVAQNDVTDEDFRPFDPDLPGQAFVSTGPYVGVNIQFSGSNLIINSPSVNTDVQLLNIRKSVLNKIDSVVGHNVVNPHHSHLLLSGVLETQANYTKNSVGPNTSDIDLTNVSLDATVFGPSDWILGFIEMTYDNGAPAGSVSNFRLANSRLYINKAFVTLGDLKCSPFYTTFGQFYVPFGTYSSVMVSDTLTKLVGRTKARSILVGFQQQDKNAFYGAAYVFRGDTHAGSVSRVNNGGLNAGFKFDTGYLSGNVGGGVIANMADSVGMQFGTGFHGNEQIVHRVPAYDLRATLSVGTQVDFIAEGLSASKQFNVNDMSFNNHGAKPTAYDLEASYSFTILDNDPSSVGVGYARTSQALAVGIPQTRTSAVFNTSLLRNTVQSLEFRHDREYPAGNVATGAGNSFIASQSGKDDNAVTAQFDYYF